MNKIDENTINQMREIKQQQRLDKLEEQTTFLIRENRELRDLVVSTNQIARQALHVTGMLQKTHQAEDVGVVVEEPSFLEKLKNLFN